MSAGNSDIKKRMDQNPQGISDGEFIEIGNDLEAITRMRGWTIIESYMLRVMNLVGLALSEKENPDQKGIARGFIEMMQWIQLSIQRKDEILEKEKQKHVAKSVSKDETERGKEELPI